MSTHGLKGLVGLAVVKNEADIIEPMIRHNLRFLDFLVVIDYNSGDPTARIIESLCAEFPDRLFLRHDLRTGHFQQRIINETCRELAAQQDIVCFVPLDADELIRADRDLFRGKLLSEKRPIHLPWVTYVPTPQDDPNEVNPVVRIKHRRLTELAQFYKTTFPRGLVGKTRIEAGSHAVAKQRRFDPQIVDGLELAHFPIRSKEQLWSKVVIGALNMRIRTGGDRSEGFQCKHAVWAAGL